MNRRGFVQASSAGLIALATHGCGGSEPATARVGNSADRANGSQRMIIDALAGLGDPNRRDAQPFQPGQYPPPPEPIATRLLADLRASGVSAVNITLGYVAGPMEPFEHTVGEIAWWDARIRANSDHLLKVLSATDISEAHGSGRVGIIYGFQNAAALGEDAGRVATFARLGVRVIQLTYNGANALGAGCMAPDGGLTAFGHDAVAQLNEEHVLVDLSHSNRQTCLDAMGASSEPVAITHTGCRALADLPRNKTDEELRALAEGGGVAGIYFMPFLRVSGQPMARDVADHIEHALAVCGEDHVGIGTDGGFTAVDDVDAYRAALAEEVAMRKRMGIGATGESADVVPFIPDLDGPEKFRLLADRLSRRGVKERVIDKLLGENFLRLMNEVWSDA